jgi:hypothetical protein
MTVSELQTQTIMIQVKRIAELEAQLDKTNAKCAEMRQQLENDCIINTDCGKGWLSPEGKQKLRKALESIVNCNDSGMTESGFTTHASIVALMKRTAKQALEESK